MKMNKQEFMKAFASSMAKMIEDNPINLLIIDELTTLGSILTAELYERDLGGKKYDDFRESGGTRKHSN